MPHWEHTFTPAEVEEMRAALKNREPTWRPQDDLAEAAIDAFESEPTREHWVMAWKEIGREFDAGDTKHAVEDLDRILKLYLNLKPTVAELTPQRVMPRRLAELITTVNFLNIHHDASPIPLVELQRLTDLLRKRTTY